MKVFQLLFLGFIMLGLTACQQTSKVVSTEPQVVEGPEHKDAKLTELLGEHLIFSEGMWMPNQLTGIESLLKEAGLELEPRNLTKLTEFPMNAIVSLGGCSASFVSPEGLVVTNHHCAYGNIQYNSKKDRNLIEDGFLAKTKSAELPASPDSRIYVTELVQDVSKDINAKIAPNLTGYDRFMAIETAEKSLVRTCEEDTGYRCRVYSFYGGLQYFLIKQLEIKDVRLVHAPRDSIGRFGGDIDNWMWPRHTGDYSFYRAYVSKDGKPKAFSEDNVPYQPKSWLKLAEQGVEENDYVMVIGYPGTTNRYRLSNEVEHQFTWFYPFFQNYMKKWIDTIVTAASYDKDAEIKYASTLAGLRNYEKNFQGMIDGYAKGNLLEKKLKLEKELNEWLASDEKLAAKYQKDFDALLRLIDTKNKFAERDLYLSSIRRIGLLNAAQTLYRYKKEQEKPDAEREPGYQDRDKPFILARLKRLDRRFDVKVDKALALFALENYLKLQSTDRVQALDDYFGLEKGLASASKKLDSMYSKTSLTDQKQRLAWLNKSLADFERSSDPFIQLAVSLYDYTIKKEQADKTMDGKFATLRPQFMAMLSAYAKKTGRTLYPDANGTLRVTYGKVTGTKPAEGLTGKTKDGTNGVDAFLPFTTLEGIAEKHTGKAPFNVPQKQLQLINAKQYGEFSAPELGTVPVNYLSTVDITGGNSGSPTLNSRGELVGLVFDGTNESINSDWDFRAASRSIHVDSRYMLWNMKYVDGAENLLEEMGHQIE